MGSVEYPMKKEYRLGVASLEEFAKMQEFVRTNPSDIIIFDCTKTTYISPAFSTLFGSLPHYGEFYNKTVRIKYNAAICSRYIIDVGILKYYKGVGASHKKALAFNSINLADYKKNSSKNINEILKQLPIELSENSEGIMISQLGEILNNAYDHSGFTEDKKIHVYRCGHWNANQDTYIVSIYDTGVGIAENVSKYLQIQVDDTDAINWAFGDGNSTQNTEEMDFPRGIGLNQLENFIKVNDGTLYVCSGKAVYIVKKGSSSIKRIRSKIRGTLYVFTLKVKGNINI